MIGWYRRTGAELPFSDPARDRGAGMEGWFWRFEEADGITIVLHGRSRSEADPARSWSLVAIARSPGDVHWAIGDDLIDATPESLDVRLPDDAFSATWTADRPWPRRRWGALGAAQAIPGLGQYWHPHLLRGTTARGGLVYAEKNWGSAFADHWWWGQAFVDEATVAFAGGHVHGMAPTALVVSLPDRLISLAPPLAWVRAGTAPGQWRLEGRGVTVEAEADPAAAHVLPVPVPEARRAELRSHQHLTGRLAVTVRRRGGIVFRGETERAGLERGVSADA